MRKTIFLIALVMLSVLAFGCTKSGNAISGKTTTSYDSDVASPDDPQIDKSYDVKRGDAPATTTTRTTTTKTTTAPKTTTTTTTTTSVSGEDKAEEVAKAFVKNLDGYKDFNGRNLRVLSSVQSGCSSCWILDLTFNRDRPYYPEKEEIIKIHVNIKDWKVDSYTFS